MDEMNSAFDIEVSPKKENKEKQIQYKKYDKNKHNKGIVKEEIVESVKRSQKVSLKKKLSLLPKSQN